MEQFLSLASADYVNQAHAMGMEVWGLIDNFNSGTDNLTFLSSTAARAKYHSATDDAGSLSGIGWNQPGF